MVRGRVGCALEEGGAVWCFDTAAWINNDVYPDGGPLPPSAQRVGRASRVDPGSPANGDLCFVTPSREAWCWAVGEELCSPRWYGVTGPPSWLRRGDRWLSLGDGHAAGGCVLSIDGRARCTRAAHADGARTAELSVVPMLGGVEVTEVMGDFGARFARDTHGRVWTWGNVGAEVAAPPRVVEGLPLFDWMWDNTHGYEVVMGNHPPDLLALGPPAPDRDTITVGGRDGSRWRVDARVALRVERQDPVYSPDPRGNRLDLGSRCEVRRDGSVWCAPGCRASTRAEWSRVPQVHDAVGVQARWRECFQGEPRDRVDGCAWSRDTLWCWGVDQWRELTLPQG